MLSRSLSLRAGRTNSIRRRAGHLPRRWLQPIFTPATAYTQFVADEFIRQGHRTDVLNARFQSPLVRGRRVIHRLIQLWRFSLLRSYEFKSARGYWTMRARWLRTRFHARTRLYKTSRILRGSRDKLSIFRLVVGAIIWQVVCAFLVVGALASIEYFGGTKGITLFYPNLNATSQLGLFTTLGQVSATFLALYFTAISLVASTAYARVPGDIRSLIIKEQVGSTYFAILAQFAGVMTVLLTALSFGIRIGMLNTLLASALCLFSVFSFVFLGIRSFHYFDPIAFIPYLERELWRTFKSVTPSRYGWDDESLQAYHQKQADELLESYASLVALASQNENFSGKGLLELAHSLMEVLGWYSRDKRRIPTLSKWFRSTHRHKDWLLTSYSEVSLALATGSSIRPEEAPDAMWFEKEACAIVDKVVSELEKRKDTATVVALGATLQNAMRLMGHQFAIGEALRLYHAVVPGIRRICGNEKIIINPGEIPSTITDRLGATELYCCALIDLSLGLFKRLAEFKVASFCKIVDAIQWKSPRTLYTAELLPRSAIEEMENVARCLDFERRVEGKVVSPAWLLQEVLAKGFVRFLDEALKAIVGEFETTFAVEAGRQLKSGNFAVASQLIGRGLEGCDKLLKHFPDCRTFYTDFITLDRSKEYQWATIDWDALHTRVAAVRKSLVIAMAECASKFVTLAEAEALPDFFGHAYSVLADECFAALRSENQATFEQLFPSFFDSALTASEKLRDKLGMTTARNTRISCEPLLDLMELSGYATILSEIGHLGFWHLTKQCWDTYFLHLEDAAQRERVARLLCALLEPAGIIATRSMVRQRWKASFNQLLREKGVMPPRSRRHARFEGGVSLHPSPLVRAFASRAEFFVDAHDVFMGVYIFKRPEAAGLEKPPPVTTMDEAVRGESSRGIPSSQV